MKNILLVLLILFSFKTIFSQKVFYGNDFKKERKTIVFFHPYMNNENYFKVFSEPLIKDYNLVFLRGGKGEENIYSWYELDIYSDSFINNNQIDSVLKNTEKVLEPFENVILVGYSQGGVIAHYLMLRDPKKYNRIISINSYLDVKDNFKKENDYRKVNMLFIYGKNDFIVNESMVKKSFKILEKFRIKYKSIEHFNFHNITKEIRNKIIKNLNDGR